MTTSKAKGATLIQLVRLLRKNKERSRELLPEHLRRYLETRIFPTSWYPTEDLAALHDVGLKLLGVPEEQGIELMGVSVAAEQYRHFYGDTQPDPLSLVIRFPTMWSIQQDSGRLDLIVEEPISARVELIEYDYPTKVMCGIVRAYSRKILELAGWGEVTAEERGCKFDGADRCSWKLGWTNPLPELVFRRLIKLRTHSSG